MVIDHSGSMSGARLTTAAARHLRLPNKGAIAPGYDADITLVDIVNALIDPRVRY